jgi:hypothetical protein
MCLLLFLAGRSVIRFFRGHTTRPAAEGCQPVLPQRTVVSVPDIRAARAGHDKFRALVRWRTREDTYFVVRADSATELHAKLDALRASAAQRDSAVLFSDHGAVETHGSSLHVVDVFHGREAIYESRRQQ